MELKFKVGDKVTYNHCLFEIIGLNKKKKQYNCKHGHSISFTSQHIWKLKKD